MRFEDLVPGDKVLVRGDHTVVTRTVFCVPNSVNPRGVPVCWVRFEEGDWADALNVIGVPVKPPVVQVPAEPFVWYRTDDETVQWPDDKTNVLFLADKGQSPIPIVERRVDFVRTEAYLVFGWWMVCPRPKVLVSSLRLADGGLAADTSGVYMSCSDSPCVSFEVRDA